LSVGSDAGTGDARSSSNLNDGAPTDIAVIVRDGSTDQPGTSGAAPDVAFLPEVERADVGRNQAPPGDARTGNFPGDALAFSRDARFGSGGDAVNATPTLASIGLTPPAPSLVVGIADSALVVTAVYSDGTTKDVTSATTFASSDTTILTATGHTITGVKAGTATLTASYSGQTATAKVTVSASALQSISIDSITPVSVGQSILVTATAIFADGTRQDVTAQATWTSSDATIATVALDAASEKEKVAGLKAGSATLKATLQGITGQAPVTVTGAALASINITPTQSILQRGVTQAFQATATYQDNTTADVTQQATWASSDTTVATIAVSGGGALVTAVGTGTSTISATVGTMVGKTTVTVTAPALSSIVVTPGSWTPNVGGVQAFTAQATYADNSTADVTLSVTWASSATTIVGISNAAGQQGQATALAVGSASISATLSGVVGTASVTVSSSQLVGIAVTPNPAAVVVGLSLALKAIGTYQNGTTQDLTAQVAWTVTNNATGSISNAAGSSGQVTGLAVGTTQATATLNGISGSATVNVTQPTLESIAVAPAAPPSVAAGVSQSFTATANYGNGTSVDVTTKVTWSSSNIAVAQISNASGSNGVAATLTQGTSTITATFGGMSGTATLTVGAPALSSITISPTTASVVVGATQTFTATAVFQNGTTTAISDTAGWATSDSTIAAMSTVGGGFGGGGGREVATGVAAGKATISVTYQGMTASATLTVTAPVAIVGLTVAPTAPAAILVGATEQFTATAVMSDGNTQLVTTTAQWTTSNAATASISNAAALRDGGAGFPGGGGGGGLATGLAAGTVTVTATYSGLSASATLTVRAPQPTGLLLTPATVSVKVNGTQQFQAVLTLDDGTTQTVTTEASWTSSNALVASVSTPGAVGGRGGGGAGAGAGGLATGIGAGTATITATYSTFTATATLTVTVATPVSIAVTPPSPSLYVSQTQALVATVVYSDGTTAAVTGSATWSSSDATVATVATPGGGGGGFGAGGGGAAGGGAIVTAMGTGTATVTATYGTLVGTATVTVTNPPLSYVQVTPTNPNIPAQATSQFTATAIFADNSARNVTSLATWTSSSSAAAVISNAGATIGRATGIAAGTSTITATYQGMSGSSVLTVAQDIASISVTPAVKNTVPGIPVSFAATATLSNNATLAVGEGATWVSSDPTVATVTAGGIATPIKAGTVTVTATYLGVSGTAALTISSATLSSINITPSPTTVTVDGSVQLTATGLYSDSTTLDLTSVATWTSSANAIATVSNAAGSRGLLTGLGSGSATVTVYFGTSSASDTVTVSP